MTIPQKVLNKLKAEGIKICCRSSVESRVGYWVQSGVLVQSGNFSRTSRDTFREEMQLDHDCAQNDSHPEVDRTLSRSPIG